MTTPLLTREELRSRHTEPARLQGRASRRLALFAVPLGLAQLVAIRWVDIHVTPALRIPIALGAFLVYIAGAMVLMAAARRQMSRVTLRCPSCGRQLVGTAGEIVMAAGRCPGCGTRLVAD